jgi:hypothetical protein
MSSMTPKIFSVLIASIAVLGTSICDHRPAAAANALAMAANEYEFKGGYPTDETVQYAYKNADLSRAIEAYRFFYPTVSGHAIFKGN